MTGFFEKLQGTSTRYRSTAYSLMDKVSGLGRRPNKIAEMVSFRPDYKPSHKGGSLVAMAVAGGGGFTALAMSMGIPEHLAGYTKALFTSNLLGLYTVGALFVGVPILYTTLYSFYEIGLGLIKNRDEFWDPCTNLELACKFMSIITDPIFSALCAVTQLLYTIGHLLMTPIYLCTGKFDQVGESLNKMGVAYLEIFNHLIVACVSPFINLTDFTIHAGQSIFCNSETARDKTLPENGKNWCGLTNPPTL